MRGIDFDQDGFVPSSEESSKSTPVVGLAILLIAIAAIGVVGYKLLSNFPFNNENTDNRNNMEQVQQQLADIEKRIDDMERRHRVALTDPGSVSSKIESSRPLEPRRPARTVYRISAGSALQPESEPGSSVTPNPRSTPQQGAISVQDNSAASQEAWRATTDRLADVVGVVGSQQGEILQTREQLNQLLAQTQRTAVQFELRRGKNRQPIGPVSLQLRDADSKKQKYSVCVYFEEKCVELKDRTVNEVVVFVVSHEMAPLELVATKISRGQIVGYLEVPRKASP